MKSTLGSVPLILVFSALASACGGQPNQHPQANVASWGGGNVYSCSDASNRFKVEETERTNWLGITVNHLTVWENGHVFPVTNGSGANDYSAAWKYPMVRNGKYSLGRAADNRRSAGILVIYESAGSSVIVEQVPLECTI